MDDAQSLRETQGKLRLSENRLNALLEQASEGIIILSAEGKPLYISPSIRNILGFEVSEMLQMDLSELTHPDDQHTLVNMVQFILENPGRPADPLVTRIKHKDGDWRWIESTLTNLLDDQSINGIVGNFRDTTSRIQAEKDLLYSNRLYNFISQINQMIVHVTEEQTLFDKACRIALEHGKFQFAWIGIANIATRTIKMTASAGTTQVDEHFFDDYNYQINGPLHEVLSGKNYYAVSDIEKLPFAPFIEYATKRGFKAAIFLVIKRAGKPIGTFNLYSSERNFFDLSEIRLLEEAIGDISFALDVLDKDKKRTAAETALQRKELRLIQAQAVANFGSWEINLATGKINWSDQMFRIYGLPVTKKPQTYESWLALVYPDDRNEVLQLTRNAVPHHNNTEFYHRIISNDGKIRHIYCHCQFEFDDFGNAIALNGVAQDITEIKTAKENILKIAEEKNTILESIGDAFFALDKDWRVTYWNKEAERLLSKSKEEILGKNLWKEYRKSIDTGFYKNYHKALRNNEIVHFQEFDETSQYWFEVSAYPSPKGLSVYFKNITSRINAENERVTMLSHIMQRNKDLEQFSFIISHNLRAPVANIIGLVEELNQEIHPPEIKQMLKQELTLSTKKLDEVILDLNSILSLKKEIVESREKVSLTNLVENIRSSIQHIIAAEKVDIETDFEAVDEINTLKSYLHSIFYNLITNSIKYRRPDVSPRIEIKSSKTADGILIEFMDNGIGINLEKKKNEIFGLYKRFHQHVEGKGIGLFMVKTQVEILGGKINIKSAVNKGTYFKIEFFENTAD